MRSDQYRQRSIVALATAVLLASLPVCEAMANETFSTPPDRYVLSGKDTDGKDAYEISAVLRTDEAGIWFESLTVRIYEKSVSVPVELLAQARNPEMNAIRVVNDAGVFGSYFTIEIPFGDKRSCLFPRWRPARTLLVVDSLGTMDGGPISIRVGDPCER
jgi:hypothetical protein